MDVVKQRANGPSAVVMHYLANDLHWGVADHGHPPV